MKSFLYSCTVLLLLSSTLIATETVPSTVTNTNSINQIGDCSPRSTAKVTTCMLSDLKEFHDVVGVVVGFLLGAFYQEHRERRARKRLRRQLMEEVKANLYSLPQKKAALQTTFTNLQKNEILPGDCVPFCEVIYLNHYPSFAPFLSLKERNVLHWIYSSHRIVDQTMSRFSRDIQAAAEGDPLQRTVKAYIAMFSSLLPDLDEQERVMKSFLSGEPEDVLYIDKSIEELKKEKFGKA